MPLALHEAVAPSVPSSRGYFHSHGEKGWICFPREVGGVCFSGSAWWPPASHPQRGFWRLPLRGLSVPTRLSRKGPELWGSHRGWARCLFLTWHRVSQLPGHLPAQGSTDPIGSGSAPSTHPPFNATLGPPALAQPLMPPWVPTPLATHCGSHDPCLGPRSSSRTLGTGE